MQRTKESQGKDFLQLMEKHMVDSDGKVVYEATTMCLDIIEFLAAAHRQILERYAVDDSKNAGILASFYMTMVTERSSQELFKDEAKKAEIDTIINMFKKDDVNFGVDVQTLIYGKYDSIMRNPFFNLDAPNVIIRTLFAESVMRLIGSVRFSDAPQLAFSNAMGVYHFVAMTAYLVSGSMDNYFGMFTDSEYYFMERMKGVV